MYKYHYLYKITNQITGEYYYGVHSTDDLKDYYFGSGSKLWENIRKYGRENFIKENLEFFPSRKQLMNAEKNLVTKEMLADPKCLNIILGGGELKGSLGYKCVVNGDGEYMMVDKNNDDYQNFMIGRICINKDGRMKYIKPYELQQYIDKGWDKGTIYESPGKDKIWVYNNFNDEVERKQISIEELQSYLDEGWKKGFKNRGEHIWIYKGDTTKLIHKEELQSYLDEGWEKGFGKHTVNGRICMIKNNIVKYIFKEELQSYLDEGWERKTFKGQVWINNGEKCLRLLESEIQPYLDKGWKRGKIQPPSKTLKVLIYDLEGNLVREFAKVRLANEAGFHNLHKYADKDKIYQNKYIIKYEKYIC